MLISKNEYRTWTPGPWTPSWTRTMDYPCGPPLIFEDKFYQKSKQVLGTLKWTKLSSALIIRVMGSSYLPWSQRFFLIFLRERDQEQAAKRRQRVAKATRRERKTSGYLGLESHFHADDRVRIWSSGVDWLIFFQTRKLIWLARLIVTTEGSLRILHLISEDKFCLSLPGKKIVSVLHSQ